MLIITQLKHKLIVVKLLPLAKTAHEYFSAEFSKRSNEVEMLLRQMCFEIMDDVEEIA